MARINWSATLETTRTSFSSTQMMLLSVDAPSTMCRAACSTCAVSSTTAGGFPGPAQMARLPLAIAAFTTAPPPVTTISRMSGCAITCCAVSMDGLDRHVTTFAGPPAPVIALFSSATVSIEHRFASGCTQKTTLLPAASMPMALQMMVEVGLVDGVIAPMTPNGAGSVSDSPWSPVTALGEQVLQAGGLLRDEAVLHHLVLVPPESRFLARRRRQRLGIRQHRRADGRQNGAAVLQRERREHRLRGLRGPRRLVDGREDAQIRRDGRLPRAWPKG